MLHTSNFLDNFFNFVKKNNLFNNSDYLLIAASGGVDSMVLCYLMHYAKIPFAIAHCNYKLRPQSADLDEALVAQTANNYQVPFYSKQFNTQLLAAQQHSSIQLLARNLRYEFFNDLIKKHYFTYVATAHHKNDVMETMLYNLCKGTGLAGLHGIKVKNKQIIRPLLFATRQQIQTFADKNNISFRQDESNFEDKYARNKIRLQVVPPLQQINPAVVETFYNNAQHFLEIEQIFENGIQLYRKNLLEHKPNNEIFISIAKLKQIQPLQTVLYEILKPYNFLPVQIPQIIASFTAEPGKIYLSNSHKLLKDRQFFILSAITNLENSKYFINPNTTFIETPNGNISIQILPNTAQLQINKSPNTAYIDADKLAFPLTLRYFKTGDYFYPIGMKQKKKKVSRFFNDLKLNANLRLKTLILQNNNDKIIWIVNFRIDERFKITEQTKQVAVFTLCT